ncbi:hypothetical protein A0U90_11925 [Kozakia baliensis]|nr:hypothetical protein A0U90_11925 [Kozakia baliensis]
MAPKETNVLAENLTTALLEVLERPDLRTIAGSLDIVLDHRLSTPFVVEKGKIRLGSLVLVRPDCAATILRHAIELCRLRQDAPQVDAAMTSFAAARLAALFHALDAEPASIPVELQWLDKLRSDTPPDADTIQTLWSTALSQLIPAASATIDPHIIAASLQPIWNDLAPTEYLMAEGGDARLLINPQTGLNRYGCSHRPRPWAVTFSSSTASSLSERGFGGAEKARQALVSSLLNGADRIIAQRNLVEKTRHAIARIYSLPSSENVLLAASGTDCELAVLAIASIKAQGRPISNILVAPEETGSGVPLAAAGCHFASDAAGAKTVRKGELIAGFPKDTRLLGVAIRDANGVPRSLDEIDADCQALARIEVAQGRHVILHQLDMSKTGLVGPSPELLESLSEELSEHLNIVVDACQARLEPLRIQRMVARGDMVMVTGSKFFTGPPFCGAVLLPDAMVSLLRHSPLPVGLQEYGYQCEWPKTVTPECLRVDVNIGLTLRWNGSLAEMDALLSLPPARIREVLVHFERSCAQALDAHDDLTRLEPPALHRKELDGRAPWDDVPTIFSFLVRDPQQNGAPLELEDARRLHRWLNADLSPWLPHEPLAALLCHLGQPVPVPHPDVPGTGLAGALRLCAGARLVSGEPSHAGLGDKRRLEREIDDARRILAKISLILRAWPQLYAADPEPRYAPLSR